MVVLSGAGISNNNHYNQILNSEGLDDSMKFTVMESAFLLCCNGNAPILVNYTNLRNQSRLTGPNITG